ncbi:MAG: hypothetical protein H7039_06855 [Bryobacteraceae bacterium]|nr:hypothetical protein [Bryobacteraceae bacterium]
MILSRVGELVIEADEHGWIARFPGAALPAAEWPRRWLSSSQDWQLVWQLSSLIEPGIAVRESNAFRVSYRSFPWLLQQGFTLPLLWSSWSPLSLEVTMNGLPGQPSCSFSVRYFLGDLQIAVDRHGRYIQRKQHEGTWLLDEAGWQLLERIGRVAGEDATWPEVAIIRDLCQEACVTTHGFLADHEIIFPASLLVSGATLHLSEVPSDTLRRVMRGWSGETMLSFATRERWIHICFDDQQIEALREWYASGCFPRPENAIVRYLAGRLGYRETVVGGHQVAVPVRFTQTVSAAPVPNSSLRYYTTAQIQTVLGCYYTARGYDVILTSEGCRTGASILAVRDGLIVVVRVESPSCSGQLLQDTIRCTAALRSLVAGHYEPRIILRGTCPVELKRRAEKQGIQLKDEYYLADMIDSEPMTEDAIATSAGKRCRSTGETIERLQMALKQGCS